MSKSDIEEMVDRLLAGAAKTVKESRYGWLLTGANARPMGLVAHALAPETWTVSLLTDGRSRKAADMRRDADIALTFQREAEDAFARLKGRAALCEDRDDVNRRWRRGYDAYFPSEAERLNAIFVDVRITRMDLWIRGVTPEPFGLQATTLAREGDGPWRRVP